MNWKKYLIENLRSHTQRQIAQDNIKRRIADLNLRLESPKIANLSVAFCGSGSAEEALIGAIYEKGELNRTYIINEQDIAQIENALDQLDQDERRIIEGLYFAKISPIALGDRLNLSRASVYNYRDNALRKMAIFLYGSEGN